jgi:hypothetical protein
VASDRKSFLIRVDPALLDSVQRWADDDLRSLNAHIEFLLRDALRRAGRLPKPQPGAPRTEQSKEE